MTAHHVWLELVAQADGRDDRMQENGRLRHLGLLEFFGSAFEHYLGNLETEDFVCFVKQSLRFGVALIEVFAHT